MKKLKILICDDDQDNLDVLQILLEMEGYIVVKEDQSSKLISTINSEQPDLLLLDIWMPEICGDEIIKIIRSDSSINGLPIIAFSASLDIEKISKKAGANQYISKPYDINEITRLIINVLGNKL
ncbi:response regulator [Chryseobacterium foetidum]|uniref:response regulator n=1 Tax=Chryseobacterium foetidum TaxID=2951057 RepID=UPI0021C987B1|nr:response regulator [Chryseobacterium foetidum]